MLQDGKDAMELLVLPPVEGVELNHDIATFDHSLEMMVIRGN